MLLQAQENEKNWGRERGGIERDRDRQTGRQTEQHESTAFSLRKVLFILASSTDFFPEAHDSNSAALHRSLVTSVERGKIKERYWQQQESRKKKNRRKKKNVNVLFWCRFYSPWSVARNRPEEKKKSGSFAFLVGWSRSVCPFCTTLETSLPSTNQKHLYVLR